MSSGLEQRESEEKEKQFGAGICPEGQSGAAALHSDYSG